MEGNIYCNTFYLHGTLQNSVRGWMGRDEAPIPKSLQLDFNMGEDKKNQGEQGKNVSRCR